MAKPGVDWADIKRRVGEGEALRALAREHGVSHQAISERRDREGWSDPARAGKRWKPVAGRMASQPAPRPDPLPVSLPAIPRNVGGLRTQENMEFILEVVRRGFSLNKAAQLAGFNLPGVKQWQAEDDDFRLGVMRAGYEYASRNLKNVNDAGDRGDWKASQWILETHPLTRDEMTPERIKQGTTFNIVINVPRPDAPDYVDITQE